MVIYMTENKRYNIKPSKIKENEWHWNIIDEDRDVWAYKCKQAKKQVKELEEDLNDALNRIEERSIDVQLLKEENGNLKK